MVSGVFPTLDKNGDLLADALKIRSNGGAGKSYDLELARYSFTGLLRFLSPGVPLDGGVVAHILRPQWNDLDNQVLQILIDRGNNGTIDDTLNLSSRTTPTPLTQAPPYDTGCLKDHRFFSRSSTRSASR